MYNNTSVNTIESCEFHVTPITDEQHCMVQKDTDSCLEMSTKYE